MRHTKKVLVIDDEPHIQRVIELKLKSQGYQVIKASDGEEGLELIRAYTPDAVVTDIMMPKLDGRTLCERTNSIKSERPFLTVIMTCRISDDEHNWINMMQDTLFMEKPFSPSRLLECIDHYFGFEQ